MRSFDDRMASVVDHSGPKGWFVAILELGAWVGVLVTGYLADKISRKYTIVLGNPPYHGFHFSDVNR
jgi:MFS family permease